MENFWLVQGIKQRTNICLSNDQRHNLNAKRAIYIISFQYVIVLANCYDLLPQSKSVKRTKTRTSMVISVMSGLNLVTEGLGCCPGGTPRKIGWGCAARFPKPLPYLWPKSAIFPTLFMTWPFETLFMTWALNQNPVLDLRYNWFPSSDQC